MVVEVDLPNKDLSLYPGMYATVHIDVNVENSALLVPDDALIFHRKDAFVPVVRNGVLHLQKVTLGHDNGINVEAVGDLRQGDLVAMNVGQSARDGEPVRPVTQQGDGESAQ
jgi:multidrug efflux pump subunit AcrA (membrane-fusion protein)